MVRVLARPVTTAAGQMHQRRGWRVHLCTQDGTHGLGEVMPLPTAGTETAEAADAALQVACAVLSGAPMPATLEDCQILTSKLGPDVPSVRCGVQCALLDILAQQQGLPLWGLWKATPRVLELNALCVQHQPAALMREARELHAAGFRTFKLKVGLADDQTRVAAVRASVPDAHIRVDANGAWRASEATVSLQALADLGVQWCEDPLREPTPAALRDLHGNTGVRLATDAPGPQGAWLNMALTAPAAVQGVVIKPAVMGGLVEAVATATRARQQGLRVWVTSLLDGWVGHMAAAHVAMVVDDGLAHGLATMGPLADDLAWVPPPWPWLEPHPTGLGGPHHGPDA